MGVRYIGSKARVAADIARVVGPPDARDGRFVDGFCGTGAVAEAAATLGWDVHLNDTLVSSVVTAAARLTGEDKARFDAFGGYLEAIRELNSIAPLQGFIAREYSPLSASLGSDASGIERRYFTVENASRIDAIRRRIELWREEHLLNLAEYRLLVADLLAAASRVANIAGTYGCYLREWSPSALRRLLLVPRSLLRTSVNVTTSTYDVLDIAYEAGDVAYFDPPYTKRQYAAYYHISETIAVGDEPLVTGVTGLRPWRHLASDYCYRTRALGAIGRLVAECPARRVFLSYSSDGHVGRSDLERTLADMGEIRVHELGSIGRYRPNRRAGRRPEVDEYLFEIERSRVLEGAVA